MRTASRTPLLERGESSLGDSSRGRTQSFSSFATADKAASDEEDDDGDGVDRLDPTQISGARYAADAARHARRALVWSIGLALPVSLVCFTIQTELAQYIQRDLHYEKPFFMLYVTHSSWWLNGVGMWCYLRLTNRRTTPATLLKRTLADIRETATEIASPRPPPAHMILVTAALGLCLTIAAATWYLAVNLTTASDVSAIYNASAFFAYAFAVPLLGEALRWDKVAAVLVAIGGVGVIAYGDRVDDEATTSRALGNIVISVGAVLYGLYEVLYKKWACPEDATDHMRSILFANVMSTALGVFTLAFVWIPLPILHVLGWERFELPPANAALALIASIAANFVYSACLLGMISLTGPVLSSVASLLSIFCVAITDTIVTGKPLSLAAIAGGAMILVAFGVLVLATVREAHGAAKHRGVAQAQRTAEHVDTR
ncbi:hypothetical protein PYCC9005_005196 [Savitreella phatthalungensis]